VIAEFARLVGDETHLDYLYVLTVADVRGTNPKLWNPGRPALFHELYDRPSVHCAPAWKTPSMSSSWSPKPRRQALALLRRRGIAPTGARGVAWLYRRVLPAPPAGGDRLAHAGAGRPPRRASRWCRCERSR
jgi:UTP:GlnB (protein PII) uridylyltransferase